MPSPSRRKGFAFERELVRTFEAAGIDAERARGSDGRALGEAADVDVVAALPSGRRLTVQAKRLKRVAAYLDAGSADLTILRADRARALAVVPLDVLLDLLTDVPTPRDG